MVLLFLALVLLGRDSTPPPASRSAERRPLASPPALPALPALPPAQREEVVEVPSKKEPNAVEPPPKSPAVEDIRESYARSLWRDLKLQAEQNPTALWAMQHSLRNFISGYGSTAAGKEAAEFLKTHSLELPPPPTPERTLADLKADFLPERPKTGWSYLWNADGAIGQAAHYRPLVWNASTNGYTGSATTYPAKGTAHHYIRIVAGGGHPGMGLEQRESEGIDRFAIFAYRLQPGQAGKIAITGRLTCNERNGSVDLRLYVNDEARGATLVQGGTFLDFSTWLGDLKEGDTIYVAVGPNKADWSDTFGLIFTIYN